MVARGEGRKRGPHGQLRGTPMLSSYNDQHWSASRTSLPVNLSASWCNLGQGQQSDKGSLIPWASLLPSLACCWQNTPISAPIHFPLVEENRGKSPAMATSLSPHPSSCLRNQPSGPGGGKAESPPLTFSCHLFPPSMLCSSCTFETWTKWRMVTVLRAPEVKGSVQGFGVDGLEVVGAGRGKVGHHSTPISWLEDHMSMSGRTVLGQLLPHPAQSVLRGTQRVTCSGEAVCIISSGKTPALLWHPCVWPHEILDHLIF